MLQELVPEQVLSDLIEKLGGPGRDRTDDLFHAMEARSQLRHRPHSQPLLINSHARAVVSQTQQVERHSSVDDPH